MCPDCTSESYKKKGFYYQKTGTYQKYKCLVCGRVWKGEYVGDRKPTKKPKPVKVKPIVEPKPVIEEVVVSSPVPSISSIAESPCFMCENVACKPQFCEKISLWLKTTSIKQKEVIVYA